MKSLIVLLVMSMTAATCATARDADEADHRLRCSQLIIRNAAPLTTCGTAVSMAIHGLRPTI
jgi:hypothetical protein